MPKNRLRATETAEFEHCVQPFLVVAILFNRSNIQFTKQLPLNFLNNRVTVKSQNHQVSHNVISSPPVVSCFCTHNTEA